MQLGQPHYAPHPPRPFYLPSHFIHSLFHRLSCLPICSFNELLFVSTAARRFVSWLGRRIQSSTAWYKVLDKSPISYRTSMPSFLTGSSYGTPTWVAQLMLLSLMSQYRWKGKSCHIPRVAPELGSGKGVLASGDCRIMLTSRLKSFEMST